MGKELLEEGESPRRRVAPREARKGSFTHQPKAFCTSLDSGGGPRELGCQGQE